MSPGFVNPDPTYHAQADRVLRLYDSVTRLRDEIGAQGDDTRRVSLNNIAMSANGAAAALRLVGWASDGGERLLVQALKLSRPEHIAYVVDDLLRAARLHLLVETQFQIENGLRNVLRALGHPTDKQSFYDVAEAVLKAAGLQDPALKLRVLNVPALMRNSLHSNGIHHGYKSTSTHETINGVTFRFDHGKPVECGSWFHIVTGLTASVEILGDVFKSGSVAALPRVPDQYAAHRTASPLTQLPNKRLKLAARVD